MDKPPLQPEDWLAFVIAAQAHRSGSPTHSAFGASLISRYFVDLPNKAANETEKRYLDAALCHAAAAIRGFAVIRQIFETERGAIHAIRDTEADAIKRLQGFGPLTPDNPWKTIVPGLGGGIWAYALTPDDVRKLTWQVSALVFAGVVVVVIASQTVVEVLVRWKARKVHSGTPKEILTSWRSKTASHYATVSVQLLAGLYAVTERYYPGSANIPSRQELQETAKAQLELLFQE